MFFQIAGGKNRRIVYDIPIVIPAAADLIRICEGKTKFINDGNNDLFQFLPLTYGGVRFRFNIQIDIFRKTVDQLIALGKRSTTFENDIGQLCYDPLKEQCHIVVLLDDTCFDAGVLRYPEDHLFKQRWIIV